jgi:cell division protein FtsL
MSGRVRFSELGLVALLGLGVVVSGLALIGAEHEARQLFVELEELKREQDRLQVDWSRLQIEQSTMATHARIEALARERLNLRVPAAEQVVIVAEPAR